MFKTLQSLFTISEKQYAKANTDHDFEPQQIAWALAFAPSGVFAAISHKDASITTSLCLRWNLILLLATFLLFLLYSIVMLVY